MAIIENVTGVLIGIKLVNGKLKPKKRGIGSYFALAFFFLMWAVAVAGTIHGIATLNIQTIVIMGVGLWATSYMLLITPYTQSSKNYDITFQYEDALDDFELCYKGQKVTIDYRIDSKGKLAFADNENKIKCVSYADGSKMSNFTKYRIVNYFTDWLKSYDLLSNETTVTFQSGV